jgi:hypothetical protein
MINSWVGICVGEQVRRIVTGTIEGEAGVDGMYTIGMGEGLAQKWHGGHGHHTW